MPGSDNPQDLTTSAYKLVCMLVKLENVRVEDSQSLLNVQVCRVCAVQDLEPGQRFSDASICFDDLLKSLNVV